jgi:hypothetical protein
MIAEALSMIGKQTEADKIAALKEYSERQTSAVDRMAALRAARLARDAGQPIPDLTPVKKAKTSAKPKKKKKR